MSAVEKSDLAAALDLLWRCDLCGHQSWLAARPARCDGCGIDEAPMTGRTTIEWRAALFGAIAPGGVNRES